MAIDWLRLIAIVVGAIAIVVALTTQFTIANIYKRRIERLNVQLGDAIARATVVPSKYDEDVKYRVVLRKSLLALVSHCTPEQVEELRDHDYITVKAKSGCRYRIYGDGDDGAPHRIAKIDKNDKKITAYCVVFEKAIPIYDQMLARMLLIQSDENKFLKTANPTPLVRIDRPPLACPQEHWASDYWNSYNLALRRTAGLHPDPEPDWGRVSETLRNDWERLHEERLLVERNRPAVEPRLPHLEWHHVCENNCAQTNFRERLRELPVEWHGAGITVNMYSSGFNKQLTVTDAPDVGVTEAIRVVSYLLQIQADHIVCTQSTVFSDAELRTHRNFEFVCSL